MGIAHERDVVPTGNRVIIKIIMPTGIIHIYMYVFTSPYRYVDIHTDTLIRNDIYPVSINITPSGKIMYT